LRQGALNEAESKALFAQFGIPNTREQAAATPAQAERIARMFDGNVVVKILSREVLHKTDIGGVALDVPREHVAQTCERLAQNFRQKTGRAPEGFLVQEHISGGAEVILGMRRDPLFGPLILLGVGGTAAELLQDTAVRLAPVSRADVQAMIDELKTSALLKGFRGRPPCDVAALVDATVAFSQMALALGPMLKEAEINPLFVLPAGQGVKAADGLAVLSPS
jgi:acyl-CoA synthetase (NDP forming)